MIKEYSVEAVLRVKLTKENIDDIVTTILEGGFTSLWVSHAEAEGGEIIGEYLSEQLTCGGAILFYDQESTDVWRMDLNDFLRGFRLWLENGSDEHGAVQGGEVDVANIDGADADAIWQYVMFGEIQFA